MTVESATMWEVRDISKAFPGVQALDHVSLALMAGLLAPGELAAGFDNLEVSRP